MPHTPLKELKPGQFDGDYETDSGEEGKGNTI